MNRPRDPYQTLSPAQRLTEEARKQFTSGNPQKAEAILEDVLADFPKDLQALVAYGIVAAETGRLEAAEQRMNRVLEVDAKCIPALCWMSHLLLEKGQINEAKSFSRRATTIDPRVAAAHAALGRCLAKERNYPDAINSYKKAVELNPNNPKLFYELADLYLAVGLELEARDALRKAIKVAPDVFGELKLAYIELGHGRVAEAQRLCERALQRDPANASSHALMGRIYTEQFKFEEAEDHWEQAEELSGKPGAVNLEKALSLNAIGEFESAMKELERSIELKPKQGGAYQSLVFAKRISSDDMPLVHQMEGLLLDNSLTENEHLNLYYALGKSYDNLGDYERAMGYFDKANQLKWRLQGSRTFDRAEFTAIRDARIKLFSKELFEQESEAGIDSDLPIAIVGMMRSGTTLAEQMLSCHPLVGGAGEQHFWGDQERSFLDYSNNKINYPQLRASAKEYVELLTSIAPGFPRVIDKNPANLQVVGSMHLAFPNVKIIHTRRNAIDTAISIWTTPMRTNAPFICNRENIVYAYRQYVRLMDHWREVLPADRFFEVNYEDLVEEPEKYARRMVDFCELEWDDAVLHPELNQRRVKTPSLWQVRQPVYKSSTERWKKYEPWLGVFEKLRDVG